MQKCRFFAVASFGQEKRVLSQGGGDTVPLVVDGKITCFQAGVTVARPKDRVDERFARGGTYEVRASRHVQPDAGVKGK